VRVIAFRHVPFEGAGRLESALVERGVRIEYADLYHPAAPEPDFTSADGLVVLGGPMSMNDNLEWLRREQRLVERAMAGGMPVLGICLGSQMLAQSLGARVYRNPKKEIGWFEIHFASGARGDRLFSELNQPETVFHWHGETFDLPAGAELLAWSDACRHQAFRAGTVYGLQFHLEVTPEMIADWCLQDENCGDIRELTTLPDPEFNAVRLTELSNLVFGRWLDQLVQKSPSGL
jgi:GMP synthase-like glutamine amidotransferase